MTCSACERLQREKAELADELQAWRDHDRRRTQEALASQRLVDWKTAFGLTRHEALILLALVDLQGRVLTQSAGIAVLSSVSRGDGPGGNIVSVYISKIRKALASRGYRNVIRTHWGEGWSIVTSLVGVLQTRAEQRAAG